jgi:Holliday junction resolvase-like predicted endonuclease
VLESKAAGGVVVMKTMIALVGEQPLPNVIPVKYYSPSRLVLAHTKNERSTLIAKRIEGFFGDQPKVDLLELEDGYNIDQIYSKLYQFIHQNELKGELLFNLTGGTKPMSFAALELARVLRCQAFYYQSENNLSQVYLYDLSTGSPKYQKPISIDTELRVDEILKLFIDKYHCDNFKDDFEKQVFDVLESLGNGYSVLHNVWLDSIGPNVEIDWILCYKNKLAVGEVKSQAKKSDGIDQVNGVTDQRTLGTYTKKFIVSAREPHYNDRLLAEAYRIKIITVPSANNKGVLSEEDRQKIVQEIQKEMEGR